MSHTPVIITFIDPGESSPLLQVAVKTQYHGRRHVWADSDTAATLEQVGAARIVARRAMKDCAVAQSIQSPAAEMGSLAREDFLRRVAPAVNKLLNDRNNRGLEAAILCHFLMKGRG